MTPLQARFRGNGYIVGEARVDDRELQILENVCNRLLDEPVYDGGNGKHRIGLGQNRRFLAHCHSEFPKLEAIILGGSPARYAREIVGEDCVLFNEQFVVKGPRTGASFAWHQDSAYVGFDHEPYVSIWIAIDDATLDNGCLRLIQRDIGVNDQVDPHEWIDDTRELRGPANEGDGFPVIASAGSMVAFSSLTMHSSGSNITEMPRRSYLVQYSKGALRHPETGELKRFAANLHPTGHELCAT